MKLNHSFRLLFFIPIICSCDPGVELEVIPMTNLLSISSFISPQDTVLTAYLFQGREPGTINNSDSALVKDAIVTISDGINFDTLSFSNVSKRYEGAVRKIEILQQRTYFLKVVTNKGQKLESQCTIPPNPANVVISGVRENDDYIFDGTWENPSSHKYYTITPFAEGFYTATSQTGTISIQLTAKVIGGQAMPSENQLISNSIHGIIPNTFQAVNPKLKVYLTNIDSNLFRYFNTYQSYQSWDANNEGNLFPNFREPQIIYSNIIGGVGIFGGFNQSISEVDL